MSSPKRVSESVDAGLRLPPLAVYIHLPWCVRKCPYCDFNSHEQRVEAGQQQHYVDALLRDLDYSAAQIAGREIVSVFFGGGTPSLFSAAAIERILAGLWRTVTPVADVEISLEANPGAVDAGRFRGYRQAGVNRLSLGVQSFQDSSLQRIGRIHDGEQALQAVAIARDSGFDNINIDLMYGLPQQDVSEALADLDTAIRLQPQHLSWYQLTIEPNTVFYSRPPPLPDQDQLWLMQQQGIELLARHDFRQYEVSAFSRDGYACRHNSNYWQFGDYLGLGAGAHSKLTATDGRITRIERHRMPHSYMRDAGSVAAISRDYTLPLAERGFEFMLNALRLKQGVALELFVRRTGLPLDSIMEPLQRARRAGLLLLEDGVVRASGKGYRYLNDLQICFMPEPA